MERLADVLWHLDGHYGELVERSCLVPSMFNQFEGYNVPEKHKKRKKNSANLKREEISSHSSKLFILHWQHVRI